MNRHPAEGLPPQLTTTVPSYAPAAVSALLARAASNATAPPVVVIAGVVAPERLFWVQGTGAPATAHKSASDINALQRAKPRPSPYTNAPLNILGGGSFRWPGTPRLDARTLENIRRCEVGTPPQHPARTRDKRGQ